MKTIKHMLFLFCFLFLFKTTEAQKIVAQQTFPIPSLGSLGSQNPLYWTLNKKDSLFYFYVTGYTQGQVWQIGKNSYRNLNNRVEKQTGIVKALWKFAGNGVYFPTTFLNTLQIQFDKNLKKKDEKQTFFRMEGSTSDTIYHFAKFGNVESLDKEPDVDYKLHIVDFPKTFPLIPALNDTVASAFEEKSIGEGIFGLKNMAPWLIKLFAVTRFTKDVGFSRETETKKLLNFRTIDGLKESNFVESSMFGTPKNLEGLWFVNNLVNKRDRRNYIMVTFDNSGKILKKYEYFNQTSKKPIVISKPVYNKKGEEVGTVSVFGYDNASEKAFLDKEKKDLNDFDVLYFDNNCDLKWKATFKHGDEKTFKFVVSPIAFFAEGDDLIFLNKYITGVFSDENYECFSLNAQGDQKLLLSKEESANIISKLGVTKRNLNSENMLYFVGNKIWMLNFSKHNQSETTKVNGMEMINTIQVFDKLYVSEFDMDFKPILMEEVELKSSKDQPGLNLLVKENEQIKFFISSAGEYTFLTLNNSKGIEAVNLKNDNFKNAVIDPFVIFSTYYINDRPNKTLYLLHEFYPNTDVRHAINKVLVTKIVY